MYKMEIGSEFWGTELNTNDVRFFLSGRTALEFIVRDILAEKEIHTAILPSYCCHTMIEPFVRHGIAVQFYDVYYGDGILKADIPSTKTDEIVLVMRYFGYQNQGVGNIEEIRKEGCVVIEDCTHSWLIEEQICEADYSFTSYRKWSGFTGIASAVKRGGPFQIAQKNKINNRYEELRTQAKALKGCFMNGQSVEKKEFLKVFSEAEELLDLDYVDYMPSGETMQQLVNLNIEMLKRKRRTNAQILISEIADIPELCVMFPELSSADVPLNVPTLVASEIRDDFRKHLVENEIYCPVHWPLSDLHQGISERAKTIYKSELSLVCDQRYEPEDMQRFVQCIKRFFDKRQVRG